MASVRRSPTSIARERFEEIYKNNPTPIRWNDQGHTESFQLTEPPNHNVVKIYCRIGDHCFELLADGHLGHRDIVDVCQDVLNKRGVTDD